VEIVPVISIAFILAAMSKSKDNSTEKKHLFEDRIRGRNGSVEDDNGPAKEKEVVV